jgi:chromosome segregation ATPase
MKVLHALLLLATLPSLFAAAPADPNQRLREALRNSMLQLRSLETERATLQANQVINENKIKDLSAQLEKLNTQISRLTKDAIAEQATAKKEIDTLKLKLEARDKQVSQLNETLAKWKSGYNEVVKIAREREALRAEAVSKVVTTERRLAERERQNLELDPTGREILERLQGFGLGTAISAREPFIGLTKVKLQNYVQDYADKLQDQKYNPFRDKAANAGSASQSKPDGTAPKASKP